MLWAPPDSSICMTAPMYISKPPHTQPPKKCLGPYTPYTILYTVKSEVHLTLIQTKHLACYLCLCWVATEHWSHYRGRTSSVSTLASLNTAGARDTETRMCQPCMYKSTHTHIPEELSFQSSQFWMIIAIAEKQNFETGADTDVRRVNSNLTTV